MPSSSNQTGEPIQTRSPSTIAVAPRPATALKPVAVGIAIASFDRVVDNRDTQRMLGVALYRRCQSQHLHFFARDRFDLSDRWSTTGKRPGLVEHDRPYRWRSFRALRRL